MNLMPTTTIPYYQFFVGAITSFEVNEDSSEIHSLYAVLPARYVKIVTNKKVDL